MQLNGRRIIDAGIWTFIIFLIMMAFWNTAANCDETEIFVKGIQISRGGLLYWNVDSQHMPLMYQLAALFAATGIRSEAGFRLAFYALFALLYGFIFIRYYYDFDRKALCLYPLLYYCVAPTIDIGTVVLSEQFQGIGMVILFYEILLFYKNRQFKISNLLSCSLASFISFYSAFTSIFAIFTFYCIILYLDYSYTHNSSGFPVTFIKKSAIDLVSLAIEMLLPFVFAISYFVNTGTLSYFYKWAYQFNVEVYAKYQKGYGSSILGALFGGISNIAGDLNISSISTTFLVRLLIVFSVILFLVEEYQAKKDIIFSSLLGWFMIACATRGCFYFHGLPVIAVFCAVLSFEIVKHFPEVKQWTDGSPKRAAVSIGIVLLFSTVYFANFKNIFYYTEKRYVEPISEEYGLSRITDDMEEIGYFQTDHRPLLVTKNLPVNPTWGIHPWFWEWEKEEVLGSLKRSRPRIIWFDTNSIVWGYKLNNYAPEIKEYISDGYYALSNLGWPKIFVREDYYYEAISRLYPEKVFETYRISGNCGEIREGDVIEQNIYIYQDAVINEISLFIATYNRINRCHLKLSMLDKESGEVEELAYDSCRNFKDNAYHRFKIQPYEVKEGHKYVLIIESPDGEQGNAITIGYGEPVMSRSFKIKVKNQEVKNTIAMKIYREGEKLPALIIE